MSEPRPAAGPPAALMARMSTFELLNAAGPNGSTVVILRLSNGIVEASLGISDARDITALIEQLQTARRALTSSSNGGLHVASARELPPASSLA